MKEVVVTEDNVWEYADGIDFCVIGSNRITHSYTKEEFAKIRCYPRNARRYWIMKDGYKAYITLNKNILIDENGKMYQEV